MGYPMHCFVLSSIGNRCYYKATSVERLWREGREYEAQKAADDAKKYSIWGAVAFAVIMILYFALLFIGVFAAAAGY